MTGFDIDLLEYRIALAYARRPSRGDLSTLFALDERLSGFVARTGEPTIGLMRLVWWRDALAALADRPPPGEPLLIAAAGTGLPPAELAAMVEGWAVLLDDPEASGETMAAHARERGGRLFDLAGKAIGEADPRLAAAGEGWALVDRARHADTPAKAAAWLAAAREPLATTVGRWPRPLRPLGMLAALAREDVARGAERLRPPGSRGRLLRILAHQLTGR
jgi:15-cis-phytoene synthase